MFILKFIILKETKRDKRQENNIAINISASNSKTPTTNLSTTTSFVPLTFKSTSTPFISSTVWWSTTTTKMSTKVTDCSSPNNLICNIMQGSFKGSTFVG